MTARPSKRYEGTMRWRGAVLSCLVALAGLSTLAVPSIADAKASVDSPYGFERTWNSAIRLVRVDMGFKLTEKDEANGYILFEYRSTEGGSKATHGSVEIVRPRDASEPVHVMVQLPEMPHYHEQVLIDALVKKLRAEYGEPPSKPRPSPPRKRDDADAGADGEP